MEDFDAAGEPDEDAPKRTRRAASKEMEQDSAASSGLKKAKNLTKKRGAEPEPLTLKTVKAEPMEQPPIKKEPGMTEPSETEQKAQPDKTDPSESEQKAQPDKTKPSEAEQKAQPDKTLPSGDHHAEAQPSNHAGRSNSTESLASDWETAAAQDYGRGSWGYWYGSGSGWGSNWDSWGGYPSWHQAWDGSWNRASDWEHQGGWQSKDSYSKQTSWGNTLMRPSTCDLFDCATPQIPRTCAAPDSSSAKKKGEKKQENGVASAATAPGKKDEAAGADTKDVERQAELQKEHHAKYMRFYRSFGSTALSYIIRQM